MAELARGSVADRPWGRTFATLGLRGVTGQLTLVADGKRFLVAFEYGAVVAAVSPLASDAAVRVALTSHLVSSSQVPEISRRQAAAPERDEIDLIAELARLGPDHALRLRRRVIAQRAARTFSINHGEFIVMDHTELPILPGCELDVRAVIYMGARTNLSEQRLSTELDQLGSRFRLRPALDDDLPQFGFTDLEQPVVERLRDGGSVAEIEGFATSFVDGRTVRAVIYALAAYNACEVEPPAPARSASPTTPPLPAPVGGALPPPAARAPVAARTSSQALPGPAPTPGSPMRRPPTPNPEAPALTPTELPRQTTVLPAAAGRVASPPGTVPGVPTTRSLPATTGRPTASPPSLATGSAAPRPSDEGLDPPTQRDGSSAGLRLPLDERTPSEMIPRFRPPSEAAPPRPGSNPGLRSPDASVPRGGSDPALRRLDEASTQRDGSSAGLRLPLDERTPSEMIPRFRPRSEVAPPRPGSNPGQRPPDTSAPQDGLDPALRRPDDASTQRDGSSAGLRLPLDERTPSEMIPRFRPRSEAPPRPGSNPGQRPPDTSAPRDGSDPALRRSDDVSTLRPGSNPGLRLPLDERTPSEVIPRFRPRSEVAPPRPGSNPGLRPPGDGPMPRGGSDPGLRPAQDAPTQRDLWSPEQPAPRGGSDPALPRPHDDWRPRDGSSPPVPVPRPADAPPRSRDGSSPGLSRPSDAATPRDGSDPALRRPFDEDAAAQPPEPVILRVPSSRPPPRPRQLQRVDSPQSHDVKALIAQRLKLLDQGADHFALFGVGQDVAPEALRRSYFALARQLHPDRLAALGISDDGKHAQRLFAQINAGFAILSDQARRASYLHVLRRGGEAAVRAEQARAEELARRILEAEEAFRRGELALKRDQPEAAVAELEAAIQLNPDEADYHALLAWSVFCAAPDKMALASATRKSLDKAIQRAPNAVAARFYLGRVERMLGRDQEALRHFREVLAAAPGHHDAATELRVIEARLAGGDKSGGGLFGRSKR